MLDLIADDIGRQRLAVVAEARSWLWTPYHHFAAIKGRKGGVDCGMLLREVFVGAGIVARFDIEPYPQDWHLHRSEERYLAFVRSHLTEFEGPPDLGDVIVFQYGRCYSHGAIVIKTEPLTVVHALMQARMVTEERLTPKSDLMAPKPGRKPPLYFTAWPKEGTYLASSLVTICEGPM